ncbi:hypothetical protein [Catellatospora chokoriensis]|uniref:Uncharacterized protein n=1 Tax=Catellatospora chokoriensis TaxID=310353 RepID=A0A8J3NWY5_9ACTN|nr:hypothetical protein [Catellatospora chokoriensis]GIF93755.1 hypothetical protein Cch02nite_71990 [Catellatospora chokoriensis]
MLDKACGFATAAAMLVGLFWMPHWPLWNSGLDQAQRQAAVQQDRRHRRRVTRALSACLSAITAVAAIAMLAEPPADQADGIGMAAFSIVSATLFVLLIRRDRRLRRRSRPVPSERPPRPGVDPPTSRGSDG